MELVVKSLVRYTHFKRMHLFSNVYAAKTSFMSRSQRHRQTKLDKLNLSKYFSAGFTFDIY